MNPGDSPNRDIKERGGEPWDKCLPGCRHQQRSAPERRRHGRIKDARHYRQVKREA
jgi:hypothetical protein